jgi:hypothetical protein
MPRTIEFIAAFGDAINRIYNTNAYVGLEGLTEPVDLVVGSPNPGVMELFAWHRQRHLFRLKEVPFYGSWGNQHRTAHGIAPVECERDDPRDGEPVFYPSPEDESFLKALKDRGPYVVFSLAASTVNRSIPEGIGRDAAQACVERGLQVLRVGRTYQQALHESFRPNEDVTHLEPGISGPGVVDAVDRLSAPGTVLAVHGATGVFCCHSAVSLAAAHARRPTFVLLPEKYHRYYTSCDDQFTFMREFPENVHGRHEDYSRGFMNCFLDRFVLKGA